MFVLGSYITSGVSREAPMGSLQGTVALITGASRGVAEAVRFVLTRPRTHRILEVAFRPVTEPSWG
jgi:NADP-dependent 3-hydroxy acid dehydrogenase YdfG